MKKGTRIGLTIKLFFACLFVSLLLFGLNHHPGHLAGSAPAAVPHNEVHAIQTGTLPGIIKESSGLEQAGPGGLFLTHNDAGNTAELFKIDAAGKLLATLPVAGAENVDWEDITRDSQGNIYIADTGNNHNKRKRMKIYKLHQGDPEQVSQIGFGYADRKNGTAGQQPDGFDCEAVFWHKGRLYLVTKDRAQGIEARLYELPDTPGEHEAIPVSHFPVQAAVTAADMSPDGKKLMLLSEGKVHLFEVKGGNFFGSKMETRALGQVGQTEGAVFTDNNTLMISSEKGGLYRYHL